MRDLSSPNKDQTCSLHWKSRILTAGPPVQFPISSVLCELSKMCPNTLLVLQNPYTWQLNLPVDFAPDSTDPLFFFSLSPLRFNHQEILLVLSSKDRESDCFSSLPSYTLVQDTTIFFMRLLVLNSSACLLSPAPPSNLLLMQQPECHFIALL